MVSPELPELPELTLIHDPGETIHLPKKPKRLPKVILSANEVQKLMDAADTRTNRG